MPTTAFSPRIFWLLVLLIILLLSVQSALAGESPARQLFTIDDYFKIKRITGLSLSFDGQMIAYAVESQSLEQNKTLHHIYISATTPGAKPDLVEEIQDARDMAWLPGGYELAFLSDRDRTTQVFSYNSRSKTVSQRTKDENRVAQFRFAPDGDSLAYITQDVSGAGRSLYERFQTEDKGVLVDSNSTNVFHFIDPGRTAQIALRQPGNLWLVLAGEAPFQINLPGDVKDFHWSSDSGKLSITYIADDMPPEIFGMFRNTSVGIFDVGSRCFSVFATAVPPSNVRVGTFYAGGEWIPGENKILLRRVTEKDPWVSPGFPDWALVDLSATKKLEETKQVWRETEIYGSDGKPIFFPVSDTKIYTNKSVKAVRSLYQLKDSNIMPTPFVRDLKGSSSLFQFSADFEQVAFVNESLTRPPEIYIWQEGQGSSQATSLNEALAQRIMPIAKEVTWKSVDGTIVHGWLLEPVGTGRGDKPWPTITYVHSGPGLVMPDEFAFYFRYWPYPLGVYALNGMAVFVPNYRGTRTFGREFADPDRFDGEPVDDIISGIERLVQRGIADPERLAVSGHSHGAWLGPLVVSRAKIFRAGSFAEGLGNFIVGYDLMSGRLNREVHDIISGATLYDDPARYIELSPELNFKGVEAAVLFEAGTRSLSIMMLGFPKAAQAAGMPSEYIIDPKTGHTITLPRLSKESATKNLDWFLFWLRGVEDPDPAKVEQYVRWREMREQQEERHEITNDALLRGTMGKTNMQSN